MKNNNIDWEWLLAREGYELTGYVPDLTGSKSGVTIASGFDLGQRTIKDLKGLPQSIIDKLTPFLSLKGAKADEIAKQLNVSDDEAKIINQFAKSEALTNLRNSWESTTGTSFDDLESGKATTLASVAFQHGDLATAAPNFWKQTTSGDWKGAYNNLMDWESTGKPSRYQSRRELEAGLLKPFFDKKKNLNKVDNFFNNLAIKTDTATDNVKDFFTKNKKVVDEEKTFITKGSDEPDVEMVDDPTYMGGTEINPLSPKIIDRWPKLDIEPYKHKAWNWRQDSFLDTDQWRDFKEGWFDENLVGMMYASIANQELQFPVDNSYNVYKDEKYKKYVTDNPDLFFHSNSQIETKHILNEEIKKNQIKRDPFWYMAGRVGGGVSDISSLFFFTKAAKPIWNASRVTRANKTTQIIAGEEMIKQSVDENRTWQEGATIIGANYLINMMLPAFKGTMLNDDVYHIKNANNGFDLENQAVNLNKNNKIIKVESSTNRWNKPNGETVNSKIDDIIPDDWKPVTGTMRATENGFIITVNKEQLKIDFKNKIWTKPNIVGENPLPSNIFKTIEEYEHFVLQHDFLKSYTLKKIGESKSAYANRINEKALEQTKLNIPNNKKLPKSIYNNKNFLNNHQKNLEELNNEAFANTFLGKLGEESNWNPIQATVNLGNLTSIKFVKKILKSSLFTKGNFKFIKSGDSLDQLMQLDMRSFSEAYRGVKDSYKKYKTTIGDKKAISYAEFKQRISRTIINPDYVDEISEVMSAAKIAKKYYDYIGDKIKQANPALNQQLILVDKLKARLAQAEKKYLKSPKDGNNIVFIKTLPDGTEITKIRSIKELRKMIQSEEAYLKQIQKNPLRDNYLNRLVKKQKIKNDIPAWRAFATASIARTMPELTEKEILVIVKSYEESFPWKSFKKYNPDAKTDMSELIIEDYIFSPSGMSGNLKRRSLDIDQEEWMKAGYLESDIGHLMSMYHKSVLPDIYLTSIFGTPNAMGGAYFTRQGYQAGLMDVAKEYEGKFNKSISKAEKQKLIAERNEILEYMESVRDLFKGTYGVSNDPTSFYSKGIKNLKKYNAITSLQGGLASIVDLGRSVFFNGFNRTFRASFEAYQKGITKHIYKMSLQESRMAGEGNEMLLNSRAMAFNDLDTLYSTGSRLEGGLDKMTGMFFQVNLLSPWNHAMKTWQTSIISTRIIEECENLLNGTISAKARRNLAQAGIDEADAGAITRQYYNYGEGKNAHFNPTNLEDIRIAKTWEWDDTAVAERFNLAMQNDLNISVITPKLADTPLWMSTEFGGLIAQFKKFSMGMTQRFLIRGLQEKDASFLGSIVMMMALGAMVDQLRSKAFDVDYSQKTFKNKIYGAFERSGAGGIFMDGTNIAHRASQGQFINSLGGPTGSQIDKIFNILSSDDSSVTAQNVRRLIPYQNIWYMDSLFDRMEQGIQ